MTRTGHESKHRRPTRVGLIGFEVIGAYKLVSGLLALALGIWSLCFLERDPVHGMERVILRLGLDPHNHVIHSGVAALTGVNRKHLHALEAGTFAYALLHLVEGIGLLRGRDWAGYLVIIATSSLIPFEIYEITRKLNVVRISLLVLNLGIVIFLIAAMRRDRIRERLSAETPQAPGEEVLP